MAPTKRKAAGSTEAAAGKVAETTSTRVTRSVTRRLNSNSTESGAELTNTDVPTKSKTAKVTGKQKRKEEEMKAEGDIEPEKSKVEEDVIESEKEVAEEKMEPEKEVAEEEIEPQKEVAEEEIEPQKETSEEDTADGDGLKERTVVIEHCKQCKSFKTRADHVKDGLEKEFPGIKVLLNPEKPRRGCFEIREEGGEQFLSLLNMKRPFGKMKELDMDEVVADIVAKLK